jgi:hypothetical protein
MPELTDADSRCCCGCDPAGFAAQEARNQRIVLSFILEQHPTQLTIPEVATALYAKPGDFEKEDAVERAIRDLVGGGLLHCHGAFVLPTRAALHFSGLELG